MKVGIDSRGANLYAGSGIGTYTQNLVLNLINNRSDTFDLIWTGAKNENFLRDNTKLFNTSGKHGGFYETYYVPNLMKNEKVDLYHIPQNGIGFPFDWDLNVVVTIHDLIPYIMPETVGKGYLNRFLKDMPNILAYSAGILTVSEYSKKDILRFFPSYPADKIYVTPLATNEYFKPIAKDYCTEYLKNNYKLNDPYILYLGGFSTRKNVKELILSFNKIQKDLKVPHKLLLGGSLRDEGLILKDLVYSLGLQDSILFTGFLDDSLLPIFYSGAEAFVYPSTYEGFGLPPLEAMSCKTPVITSNLTSIPEVTGDNAILINPFDKDQLSQSLLDLLNNEYLKDELGEKGYKRSLHFSWKQTASNTLDAYNDILNSIYL
ncbi:glycosyltransferase family 4 protein [Clostridium paraputrificum]|uniref:glycosyltransferase family 4 protein n=1 Tax=Clostridium TaxID=1485 RepID=UPI003D3269E3